MDSELLFVEFGDVAVPFLWEDGRLDFLTRRRFETEATYERMIAQYEHALEGIRRDLAASPHDHSLIQMELLYRNRIIEARQKMHAQVAELRDETREYCIKLDAMRQREAEEASRPPPSHHNQMMFGHRNAYA
jgi:hypothetical protein